MLDQVEYLDDEHEFADPFNMTGEIIRSHIGFEICKGGFCFIHHLKLLNSDNPTIAIRRGMSTVMSTVWRDRLQSSSAKI